MDTAKKTLFLYWLAINYAVGTKTRAEALDLITDKREKNGASPNTKEAGAFFDRVRDIAETKDTAKNKTGKLWDAAKEYSKRI